MDREEGVLLAARALSLDVACAEVLQAWSASGIDSILLKGATTERWLHPEHEGVRPSVDIDLLVDPARVCEAERILRKLGFAPSTQRVSRHAHPWLRTRDGAIVDLHLTLWGPNRPAPFVWRELSTHTEIHRVAGADANALDLPGRALHVVLHAAQHRELPGRPVQHLRLALEQTDLPAWREAGRLADRLWALAAFAEGLLLDPLGRELLQRLPRAHAALLAEQLVRAPGVRRKVRVIGSGMTGTREPPAMATAGGTTRPRARRTLRLLYRAPAVLRAVPRARARDPELG